ncbi:MAG TPA: hypothetical protein ENN87_11730 [Phycisphaerales bacterium]|nr:hypothetical protein [Phycisphaerales bacterium]
MDTQAILDDLLRLLQSHGVVVRTEAMGGGGAGLCVLKDRRVFFVDSDGPLLNTAIQAARALDEVVSLDVVYLRPQVRDFVEQYTGRGEADAFD